MSKIFKRAKRCNICGSKLDKKGVCGWSKCPSKKEKK